MTCRYCSRDAKPDDITCGGDWCVHLQLVAERDAREIARSYPELAKRAGFEMPKKKTEEELLKELGF